MILLLAHIRVLSEEIGPRPGGLGKEWASAAYIQSVLEEYGYETVLEEFPVPEQWVGGVLFPDGQEWEVGAFSGRLLEVGLETAPGANDNASGTAVVLELARILRGYNTDKEIRFALFGSEERGLLGSRYHVGRLTSKWPPGGPHNFPARAG